MPQTKRRLTGSERYLRELGKSLDELTDEEFTTFCRLRIEEEARTEQTMLRKARQEAYERDRERRARTHRLIVLGAEIEASGLAEILKGDADAVYGAAVILAKNAKERPELVERAAEIGRERERSMAHTVRPRLGKKRGDWRWRVSFTGTPPQGLREELKEAGFRWRRGLRSWVGETLPDALRKTIEELGGAVVELTPQPPTGGPPAG